MMNKVSATQTFFSVSRAFNYSWMREKWGFARELCSLVLLFCKWYLCCGLNMILILFGCKKRVEGWVGSVDSSRLSKLSERSGVVKYHEFCEISVYVIRKKWINNWIIFLQITSKNYSGYYFTHLSIILKF